MAQRSAAAYIRQMTQTPRIYTALALAGTIPFIAGAVLPWLGYESLPPLGPWDELVASYGLAIVSFLAGAHWGLYLAGRAGGALNLFVMSNVILLAVWFAYIGAGAKPAIGVQLVAFAVLLFIDRGLRAGGVISADYFRVRVLATTIVAVCLLSLIVR